MLRISNLECIKIKSIQDVWQIEAIKIPNKVRVGDRIRKLFFSRFPSNFKKERR